MLHTSRAALLAQDNHPYAYLESFKQFVFLLQLAHVQCGPNKLLVIQAPVVVQVGHIHNLCQQALGHDHTPALQALPQLVQADGAAVVCIHGFEQFLQTFDFILGHVLRKEL
jgi:hypothetical protein